MVDKFSIFGSQIRINIQVNLLIKSMRSFCEEKWLNFSWMSLWANIP